MLKVFAARYLPNANTLIQLKEFVRNVIKDIPSSMEHALLCPLINQSTLDVKVGTIKKNAKNAQFDTTSILKIFAFRFLIIVTLGMQLLENVQVVMEGILLMTMENVLKTLNLSNLLLTLFANNGMKTLVQLVLIEPILTIKAFVFQLMIIVIPGMNLMDNV